MRLGFIGTGIITTAVVRGFCNAGMEDLKICLSPRNAERAAALKADFPEIITVAENNQQVVDASEWIFFAVLPKDSEAVLTELAIPEEKHFINLVLNLSTKHAREVIGSRRILADVVPLTFAAEGFGPSVIYVPEATDTDRQLVADLMANISTPVVVETANQIAVLRAMTGMMSPYYMLLTKLTDWCVSQGMEEASARAYVTSFTGALSRKAAGYPGELEELAREMTPGGINWQALTHLEEMGAYDPWTRILEPILKRVIKE